MTILEGKAEALRKSDPSLTREQAFARAYTDRANAELAKIERAANEARFAEQAASSYTGDNMQADLAIAKRDTALDALEGQGRRASQGQPGADANRRLSPRSTRTRPIGRWLPRSGSRRVGRLCTPSK